MNNKALLKYNWDVAVRKNKSHNLDHLNPLFDSTYYLKNDLFMRINGKVTTLELSSESNGLYPVITLTCENIYFLTQNSSESMEKLSVDVAFKLKDPNYYGSEPLSISDNEKNMHIKEMQNITITDAEIFTELLEQQILNWCKENILNLNYFLSKNSPKVERESNISLNGWDQIFCTSYAHMNQIITSQKLYPQIFDYKDVKLGQMKGTFLSWELTDGGDGRNLNFKCIYDNKKTSYINEAFDINIPFFNETEEMYTTVQVNLEAFNRTSDFPSNTTGENNGDKYAFQVKKPTNKITIVNSKYPIQVNEDPLASALLDGLTKTYFTESYSKFEQIFAYFQLNETAKNEKFQWLRATTAYYGVSEVVKLDSNGKPTDELDFDKSIFGILSMTEGHTNETPNHNVDARLLKETGSKAALGISLDQFTKHWLFSALMALQIGTPDQFEFNESGTEILNKEKIKLMTLNDEYGIWSEQGVYVEKGNFSLGIVNNRILLTITDATASPKNDPIGATLRIDYSQKFKLELRNKKSQEGVQLIPVDESHKVTTRVTRNDPDAAWKDLLSEIFVNLILAALIGAFVKVGTEIFKDLTKMTKSAIKVEKGVMKVESNAITSSGKTIIQTIEESIPTGEALKMTKESAKKLSQTGFVGLEVTTTGIVATNSGVQAMSNTATSLGNFLYRNKMMIITGIIAELGAYFSVEALKDYLYQYGSFDYDILPTIDDFVENLGDGIDSWPDNSEFKLQNIELKGAYILGGDLVK